MMFIAIEQKKHPVAFEMKLSYYFKFLKADYAVKITEKGVLPQNARHN